MISIIIDTSFFVKCAEFGIDLFTEFDRVIPQNKELLHVTGTREELEKLASSNSKLAKNAKVALLFLKRTTLLEVPEVGIVDDRILIASQNLENPVVATYDSELKKAAKALKAGLVVIRQKKYLQFSPKAL